MQRKGLFNLEIGYNMGYMTFGQQVAQHLHFLREAGLELEDLTIDSPEFIRCRATGGLGRGEYAYKTASKRLNNGLVQDKLLGYQILNANGSKIFAKGIRTAGLFHQLTKLVNGIPIGIAESYVTAATCLELVGFRMVTAFTSDNLKEVAKVLQQRYPNSPMIIFADNDRHLNMNKGVISANEALAQLKNAGIMLIPSFDGYPATRDYSDWNDLVREIGHKRAREQIQKGLSLTQSARISFGNS